MAVDVTTKTFPVVEIFGPTIQGEGMLAGRPTHFLRMGLCDYRCSWCDSMYSVEPVLVKQHAEKLDRGEIVARLSALEIGPDWVTISGGNPAIHDLGELVTFMQDRWLVSVETQGSMWRPWLGSVDALTVSPKPPSSGMVTPLHTVQTDRFLDLAVEAMPPARRSLKVVVFDDTDYEWALALFQRTPDWEELFLSVGTDPPEPGEPLDVSRRKICDRYEWLCSKVAADPYMSGVAVFPQLHALAWGHARGV